MKKILLFLALLLPLSAANVLIRNLTTTIVLPSSNTYVMYDGATQGTGKFLLANLPQITTTRTTLAALSVSGISTGVAVQTLGGSSIGDGAASLYYYSSSSTATPNGTTVIQPTVGSGRWLIAVSGSLPAPTLSTLGGVFSKAVVAHTFLTGIGTDGSISTAIPAASDISGLGTMATQAASSVAITGGTINGTTIGATTKATGAFTTLTTAGTITATVTTGTGIQATDGTVTGGFLPITGPALAFGTTSNHNLSFWINSSAVGQVTATGLNGIAIGQGTPAAGSFTTLTASTPLPVTSGGTGSSTAGGARTALGLGTLALQDANNVSITGGTGAFGTLSASGNLTATNGFLQVSKVNANSLLKVGNFDGLAATSNAVQIDTAGPSNTAKLQFFVGGVVNSEVRMATNGDPIEFVVSTTKIGGVTSTGLNGMAIGVTTPAVGNFTTSSWSTNANIRMTKGNLHVDVNVRDFGAVGNGSTDDTAAFTAAVAALPSTNAVLYIPAGKYLVTTNDAGTSGLSIASRTGLTVIGDGWGSTTVKANAARAINILSSCSNVDISGITFDGGCTTRTAGGQAVVIDASKVSFCNNSVINSGEFAVCLGRNAPLSDAVIANNFIGLNYADGINLYRVAGATVANNVLDGPDDDVIAVGLSTNVTVSGNVMRARSDLGTTWGRGLAILYGSDGVNCSNNLIEHVKQMGIYISADGGPRVNDITVSDSTVRNVCLNSGHAVEVFSADNVTLDGLRVYNPASGNCIEIRDWNNLAIRGGALTQTLSAFCRGIHADEDGSLTGTWTNLSIKDVVFNLTGAGANSSVYLNPTTAVTMAMISITGITSNQAGATDYIYVNPARVGTIGKIGNNVKLQSANTVNPASSTGVITVFNNN